MADREEKIKQSLLNVKGVDGVRIEDREPIVSDFGGESGTMFVFVVSLKKDKVDQIQQELEQEEVGFSDTLRGVRNEIELDLNLSPGDYIMREKDKRDIDLDVGEMYVSAKSL